VGYLIPAVGSATPNEEGELENAISFAWLRRRLSPSQATHKVLILDTCHAGSTTIRTPNVDRMAAEGMKLVDFYAAPVCSPSRASLMTGCYPRRVGIDRAGGKNVLFPGQPEGLNPSEVTIAEVLKGQGYATACIGKWHLGDPAAVPADKPGLRLLLRDSVSRAT